MVGLATRLISKAMTVPSVLFPLLSPCSLIEKWDVEDAGSEVVE